MKGYSLQVRDMEATRKVASRKRLANPISSIDEYVRPNR